MRIVAVAAVVLSTTGCPATQRTVPLQLANALPLEKSAEPAPYQLPDPLARLGLLGGQREAVLNLVTDLRAVLADARAQQHEFRAAAVDAAASCQESDGRMHLVADRFIEAGERARPAVLDAINALHALLTPAQRAELVDPILRGDESLLQDGDNGREQSLSGIAEALDLSLAQKLQLMQRAATMLSISQQTTRELRDQFVEAAQAFKQPFFDIRQHALARAPVVALYTRLMLDLAKIVLPVLEAEQCQRAAALLRERYTAKAQ